MAGRARARAHREREREKIPLSQIRMRNERKVFRWWNESAKFCDFVVLVAYCFAVGFYDSDELILANQLKKDLCWSVDEWVATKQNRWEYCAPIDTQIIEISFRGINYVRKEHSQPLRHRYDFFLSPFSILCSARAREPDWAVCCYCTVIGHNCQFHSSYRNRHCIGTANRREQMAWSKCTFADWEKQLNFDLVRTIRFASNGECAESIVYWVLKHHHRLRRTWYSKS